MTIEIKVPVLPESVADATIVTWHKQPGDFVEQDENLVDVETDKVMLEVPAPVTGVLREIKESEGTTVVAQQLLAILEEGASAEATPISADAAAPEAATAPVAAVATADLTPAARRAVGEAGVDPSLVQGTGKGGRITPQDVTSHQAAASKPAPVSALAPAKAAIPVNVPQGIRTEERVPMSRLRARVAERLVEAQQTAAMLTTFNEINMKAVMALRKQYKDSFEKKHGVRLGFMSFFTKAVIEALKRFPAVNASIDGTDIIYHGYYDIGMAVSTERGLVVPVIRDADQKNMAGIESTIGDFGARARQNKITLEEMTGGTFTITNGGVFGSLLSTPILNPPQVAILGMHKIEERPVVENGEVVVRPMMYVALTYDHRIIDGKESVQFLATVKQLLEDPARLLLEV